MQSLSRCIHTRRRCSPHGWLWAPTYPLASYCSTMDDPMLICSLLPASFFFREHQHHGNRWSLCAAEICYSNVLLGQFFQSGKTLPIQVPRCCQCCCKEVTGVAGWRQNGLTRRS